MLRRSGPALIAVMTTVALLAGCGSDGAEGSTSDSTLRVYATTGHLADSVSQIAPEAEVTTMVGPGGDPHTYQPSTRDIQAMHEADLVVWIGLDLEVQLYGPMEALGDAQVAVGDRIPADLLLDWPERGADGAALKDPHIWNDPQIWVLVVEEITAELSGLDPTGAATYRQNADDFIEQINQAADRADAALADIPVQDRILITGHDAFAYFGSAYDFEIHATDVISTEAQLSAQEISALADLIVTEEIQVIFRDNQANPQAITSLSEAVRARGWEVRISDAELFADSLGADPGVDSYLGAFEHNVRTIAEALIPGPAPGS